MIRLSNLHKRYRMGQMEVHALRGVSLTIEPGEFLAIMGASGSGKSTLLHLLGLLDVPDSGSYQLLGQEVAQLSQDELAVLRGKTVGFVFQQFFLLARATALENVSLPLLYNLNGTEPSRPEKLLAEVGLADRVEHTPAQLSGGQQQRVAIARALVNKPSILFADEPTGNLDSASRDEILEILTRLNQQGLTIVMVTHEQEIARAARRIIRMRDGVIESDERLRDKPGTVAAVKNPGDKITAGSPLRWRELREHFRQALKALLANRIRSALSMLGILIGVAAVIAMMALGSGARESVQAQLASLGSNLLVLRPGSRNIRGVALETGTVTRFTMQDAQEVQGAVPLVVRTAPSVTGRGQVVYGSKNWNTQVTGTIPDYALMRAYVPVVGRFFSEDEIQKRARVAAIGMTIVRELFGEANPIGEFIKINRVNFQVIGILPEKGVGGGGRDQDDTILIPITTAMRRLFGKDYVDSIDIQMEEGADMKAAEDQIQDLIIRRHRLPVSQQDTFNIRNLADLQAAMSETSRTMSWLLASIAAISLLVGGIGIMNIMLVSVTERTREIGIRKAIGARRADILAQFLIEAVVVSSVGGLIGILLGWTITLGFSQLAGWAASISTASVILAVVFSAGVGVIFGLWPARKASQLNPIEALRYE